MLHKSRIMKLFKMYALLAKWYRCLLTGLTLSFNPDVEIMCDSAWRGQEEERERKFWVIFVLAWFDSMAPGPGILNSWLAKPRWQLVAASVRSAAWKATKTVRECKRKRGGSEQQTDVISERNQKRWTGNSLHNEARKGKDERLWRE